jgi:hypothetical protein
MDSEKECRPKLDVASSTAGGHAEEKDWHFKCGKAGTFFRNGSFYK